MMKTVKKEATSIKNLVTMTVDTTISICTDFVCAEKLIKRELKKRYKVYTGARADRLIDAWEVVRDPKSWKSFEVKQFPEYEWLANSEDVQKPIMTGILSVYMNSSTRTWWIVYTILECNEEFANTLSFFH